MIIFGAKECIRLENHHSIFFLLSKLLRKTLASVKNLQLILSPSIFHISIDNEIDKWLHLQDYFCLHLLRSLLSQSVCPITKGCFPYCFFEESFDISSALKPMTLQVKLHGAKQVITWKWHISWICRWWKNFPSQIVWWLIFESWEVIVVIQSTHR